ncbi:transcriptional regulator GlcC [Pusillimonas noertemannii]|uniref:GntR family transcriptional regulator n=1 Tax=Pusillimonas noertemannii TaxID=305977 RepID=A0A2U1CH44_9BURK|nr:transcriptional regulator GlcC [Pusillimonas noertemannii]NYT68242.1 transcriptional regulator GlcC [Pusillimonas noertemannii]PVY60211.1 GntR family transcriptional regulator [Pusillimonas noertemannii]TFL10321.1 transcriptional regulator GlcC [Pusillimonas noertemannii]
MNDIKPPTHLDEGTAPDGVADRVAARIERLISDSVLKPGQPLPSERMLTERLAVSRSALREGLKLLRGRGLIRTAQGKRSVVANLLAETSQAPMLHLLTSQPRTLYDLLEVREFLEAESAGLAAERGTPADHVLITRRYRELAAAVDQEIDSAEHARLDHAFHLAICEASHNQVLVHTLASLNDLMLSSVFASLSNLYHRSAHKRQIDRHHARLFKAVTGRLPDAARRAAREHIRGIRHSLLEIEQEEQRLFRATLRRQGDEIL